MKSEQHEKTDIYKLNCELADALCLPRKEELDRMDHFYSYGGKWERWDRRGAHIRLHNKTPFREVDFTKRVSLLMAYAFVYKFKLDLSAPKPVVTVPLEGELDPIVISKNESLVISLMEALIARSKAIPPEFPQFLRDGFEDEL